MYLIELWMNGIHCRTNYDWEFSFQHLNYQKIQIYTFLPWEEKLIITCWAHAKFLPKSYALSVIAELWLVNSRAPLQLWPIRVPDDKYTYLSQSEKVKSGWSVLAEFESASQRLIKDASVKCAIAFEISSTTIVLRSPAKALQALANRKSPLRTAILFPISMTLIGPREGSRLKRLTTPRWTRKAVWIISEISARALWLGKEMKVLVLVLCLIFASSEWKFVLLF